MFSLTGFAALILDRLLIWPSAWTRRIGHPVVWIGWLIDRLEERLNRPELGQRRRRVSGVLTLAIILVVSLTAGWSLHILLSPLPFSWLFEALLASVLLAHRELADAVEAVAEGLEFSESEGRTAVAKIVGRDTNSLDNHGIARAAVESLAENASDGVIAPLFWLCLFGLPGIVAYKAINTADSMVGHKNLRYREFGWASARLDDLANWIPARLTALFYMLGALFVRDSSPAAAWQVARSDAPRHASSNAGWPEAALAGALGFGLGGPRAYGGKILDLPKMGDGRSDLGPADIRRAIVLTGRMAMVALVLVGGLALIWH